MTRIQLATIPEEVDMTLPPNRPDGSRLGVNYADAFGKKLNGTLADGRPVIYKRRGLQLTLTLGDQSASAIMDRLAGREDPVTILHQTLTKIADQLGYDYAYENRSVYLSERE